MLVKSSRSASCFHGHSSLQGTKSSPSLRSSLPSRPSSPSLFLYKKKRSAAAAILKAASSSSTKTQQQAVSPIDVAPGSLLEQLANMTVLSIDSGDLNVVRAYAQTGFITDATTNPLFVSQAGLRGEGEYLEFVNEAVSYAKANAGSMSDDEVVNLAIDKLSVNLGLALMDIIDGNVSTEVDIRLSFDADASVERARRLISLYEEAGCANAKQRVLVKLAGTWEGIQAARVLEAEGIRTNITLVFSEAQAKAAGDAKAHLISPFPGRVLEWSKVEYNVDAYTQDEDPGVVMVRNAQTFYNAHAMNTINMPASWRSSTGTEPLDQVSLPPLYQTPQHIMQLTNLSHDNETSDSRSCRRGPYDDSASSSRVARINDR